MASVNFLKVVHVGSYNLRSHVQGLQNLWTLNLVSTKDPEVTSSQGKTQSKWTSVIPAFEWARKFLFCMLFFSMLILLMLLDPFWSGHLSLCLLLGILCMHKSACITWVGNSIHQSIYKFTSTWIQLMEILLELWWLIVRHAWLPVPKTGLKIRTHAVWWSFYMFSPHPYALELY